MHLPDVTIGYLKYKENITKDVFIPLFGQFGGDVWHVAAAEILGEYARTGKQYVKDPFERLAFRTCITVNHVDEAMQAVSVRRARVTWKYLASLGLKPILLRAPDKSRVELDTINDDLTWDECNMRYKKQNELQRNNEELDRDQEFIQRLDEEFVQTVLYDLPPALKPSLESGPRKQEYLLPLLASTSVVISQMKYLGFSEAKRSKYIWNSVLLKPSAFGYSDNDWLIITNATVLGIRLSGARPEGEVPRRVREQAGQKFRLLKAKIWQIRNEINNLKGVVLFNFRTGDVNHQHDSNVDIFHNFRAEAEKRKLAVIAIPQMHASDWDSTKRELKQKSDGLQQPITPYKRDWVFDLLDVDKPGSPQELDNRVKACFWYLVAVHLQTNSDVSVGPDMYNQDRCVHGIVGGRSGSMDLPAFVGMNAFSWDEPNLTMIKDRNLPEQGFWTKKHYASQFPQMLRLLNEYPIMTTGFLDAKGSTTENIDAKKEGKRVYTALNVDDGILNAWLGATPSKHDPLLPKDLDPQFFEIQVQNYQKEIEKTSNDKKSQPPLTVRAIYMDEYKTEVAKIKKEQKARAAELGKNKGKIS
ncbi:hypothetical protein F4801DRAFT_601905 [Xylaria longipes]|nr:hypothetical protein F4801DRAFT_601905 [Xylaria longipes]